MVESRIERGVNVIAHIVTGEAVENGSGARFDIKPDSSSIVSKQPRGVIRSSRSTQTCRLAAALCIARDKAGVELVK
jgi:hypothetical protein